MFKQSRCFPGRSCGTVFAIALLAIGVNLDQAIAQTAPTVSTERNQKQQTEDFITESDSSPQTENSETERDYFGNEGHSGNQVAGDSRSSCNSDIANLSSITPKSGLSKTTLSHPKLWFHLPKKVASTRQFEFVLQDVKEDTILREAINISHDDAYFSVKLPDEFSGLKPNEKYIWFLKLHCSSEENSVPLYVSGTLARVMDQSKTLSRGTLNSRSALEYAEQDLWLDAVDRLFIDKQTTSNRVQWLRSWQKVVNSATINLELVPPQVMN